MGITVNITKAKNIWKDKIRRARKPKLESLDVEFMQAQETGADTSAIVAKKKELRDFPSQVDSKICLWQTLINAMVVSASPCQSRQPADDQGSILKRTV